MKNQSRFLSTLFIVLAMTCSDVRANAFIGFSIGIRGLIGNLKKPKESGKTWDTDVMTKFAAYLKDPTVINAIYGKFYDQNGDNGYDTAPVDPTQYKDVVQEPGQANRYKTVYGAYDSIRITNANTVVSGDDIVGLRDGGTTSASASSSDACLDRSLAGLPDTSARLPDYTENAGFNGGRHKYFAAAIAKFFGTFELSEDATISDIFMSKDSNCSYSLSDGKMLDLNMHFTLMWDLSKDFGVGVWGKLGWTNMEHVLKGGMEGYKLSHSMYGSLGAAIGLGQWISIRVGLGLSRSTLSFKPTSELIEMYDEIVDGKNGVKNLLAAAAFHSTAVKRMNANAYTRPPSVVTTNLPDLGQTVKDLFSDMPGKPSEQSSDAINLDVVFAVVFRIPVSDVVSITFDAGVTVPTQKVGYSNVGLDKSSVDLNHPTGINFNVGFLYHI